MALHRGVTVNGHPLTAVSSWSVQAAADGIPVVTLTLVGPGALKLILASDAARAEVSDETREALESWAGPRRSNPPPPLLTPRP